MIQSPENWPGVIRHEPSRAPRLIVSDSTLVWSSTDRVEALHTWRENTQLLARPGARASTLAETLAAYPNKDVPAIVIWNLHDLVQKLDGLWYVSLKFLPRPLPTCVL